MKRLAAIFALGLSLVAAVPASAITFGHLDGDAHPWVGAMVAPTDEGPLDVWCSGTLIAPRVFLTASHCTIALSKHGLRNDQVWVTFRSTFSPTKGLIHGTAYTNPLYASGGQNNTYDVAVIVLDHAPAGITPARLPTAHLLDQLALRSQRFVAVGYGTVREDKTHSWSSLFWDPRRRWADQGFRSLTKSWLNLSMNPSVGSGGTCYGDSGGPHFVGNTNVIAAITVTGDAPCRATDVTYRMDTESARSFLSRFVTLP